MKLTTLLIFLILNSCNTELSAQFHVKIKNIEGFDWYCKTSWVIIYTCNDWKTQDTLKEAFPQIYKSNLDSILPIQNQLFKDQMEAKTYAWDLDNCFQAKAWERSWEYYKAEYIKKRKQEKDGSIYIK